MFIEPIKGIGILLPEVWALTLQTEGGFAASLLIKGIDGNLEAELEMIATGLRTPEEVISIWKESLEELFLSAGAQPIEENSVENLEFFARAPKSDLYIAHYFRKSSPVIHLSARGVKEDLLSLGQVLESITLSDEWISKSKGNSFQTILPLAVTLN